MKNYYRIMLGRKHALAEECFAGGFIATGYGIEQDLTGRLTDELWSFKKEFIPIFLSKRPDKSRIAAGLACGTVWTICKGIKCGDIVLSPDGTGVYHVGEIVSDYYFVPGESYCHRRKVKWLSMTIDKAAMSEQLQNSTRAVGTLRTITNYAPEIERFLKFDAPATVVATDPVIEDPSTFAMEEHLENFLVKNWDRTELSKDFVIFQEDGEPVGQQYQTDCGRIDILAISKDNKRILVVELKRGRSSDVVIGQTLRYMGFVKEEIAEPDQTVEGAIIALEDDRKLHWALTVVPKVAFYRYQIDFKLVKA